MRTSFDRRVLSDDALAFIRACQARVTCHLGGGAALAGAYLGHRRSGDIDLFVHDRPPMRELVELLPELARSVGGRHEARRDAGHHHRGVLVLPSGTLELDVVHEPTRDLSGAERIEGVLVESLLDLRASKLTCLLSRTEPRDLVDVLFLERAGFAPEDDLFRAAQKDAGTDPAVLAWLLRSFRVQPLPDMLEPLTMDELRAYRDELGERFRRLAAG
jgi:hypothetical protein